MSTTINIPVINKSSNKLPEYAHEGDAGFDFRANVEEIKNDDNLFNSTKPSATTIIINPKGRALIPTGLYMEIPKGYELQVRPRSGLAVKHGITVLNSPGTIDADYRGECGIILINTSDTPYNFEAEERIGQFIIKRDVVQAEWEVVESLDETERGEGGFGHSGKK